MFLDHTNDFVTMSKIAIIAHTPLKQTALNCVKYNLDSLRNFWLIATEGTALMIQQLCSLSVEAVFHGLDGGDIQLAAQILYGDITAVLSGCHLCSSASIRY